MGIAARIPTDSNHDKSLWLTELGYDEIFHFHSIKVDY